MHDGMQYEPIQGQEPFKVGNTVVFKSYLLRHLQWKLATDHGFLKQDTISKFGRARFVIFGLFFVSRNFEVGTNVSGPCTGLIFCHFYNALIVLCLYLYCLDYGIVGFNVPLDTL